MFHISDVPQDPCERVYSPPVSPHAKQMTSPPVMTSSPKPTENKMETNEISRVPTACINPTNVPKHQPTVSKLPHERTNVFSIKNLASPHEPRSPIHERRPSPLQTLPDERRPSPLQTLPHERRPSPRQPEEERPSPSHTSPHNSSSDEESPRKTFEYSPVKQDALRVPSYFSEHSRHFNKDHSSPPNVTVVQPSAPHSMFPFLYPYVSSASGLPYPMGHLFSGSSSLPHGFPFLPSAPHTDLSHLQQQSAAHVMSSLSQFPVPGHPLLQSPYSSLAPQMNSDSAISPQSSPSMGPMFHSRSSPRFTPYSIPLSKTTSPVTSSSIGSNEPISPVRSGITRPSPIRPRSPIMSIPHPSRHLKPTNEIKSIERLLNGLESKRGVDHYHERSSTVADN